MKADKRVLVTVKNVPDYAKAEDYIVARAVNGELWFYGAYATKEKAEGVVEEIIEKSYANAVIIH